MHTTLRRSAVGESALREGTRLGVLVASCTWLWIATVDVIAGEPFYTFGLFGDVTTGTGAHYILNILYGIVLCISVRGPRHAPSLIIAVIFGLVMMEVAFAMLSVMLGQAGLGALAWLRIFVGSLFGLAIALGLLSRRYPLAARLREAEEER